MIVPAPGGVTTVRRLEQKRFESPEETRTFAEGMGHLDLVTVGGTQIGRGVFEPGWRWSSHVKPIAGTDSCQAAHTGVVVQGRMAVRMDDGAEVEYEPGDVFFMPSGHDAWIVGDDACVLYDVTGMGAYAKPE
jgi:quercetin dioxygenase-like cupin family protein